jgi:hypothetical protein
VELIEDRHKRVIEEIKKNIYERRNRERLTYSKSLDRFLLKKKEEEVLKKEKDFKKFENFVSIYFIILLIIVFYYERKER